MRKKARDLKKGEKIAVSDQICTVEELEVSEVGKQGKAKVRLVISTPKNEKLIIIRPDDYMFEVK